MKGASDSQRQLGNRPLLMLTQVVGSPLLNPAGERLGMVEDLIVRLGDTSSSPTSSTSASRRAGWPTNELTPSSAPSSS
jgi:hypothetical protein